MQTRAVVMSGTGQVGLENVDIPPPATGEVIVEVTSSVISPGTELRCLKGTQGGLPGEKFIPGYAASGIVTEVGPGAEAWLGKRVFVRATQHASLALNWGGHVAHAVAHADTLIELDDRLDLVAAPVARLFAIAHRGLVLSRPVEGMVVGVVGLGVIGQCSARLFHARGCRVIGVDAISERVAALQSVGVEAVVATGSPSATLLGCVLDGVNILVDATGSERVLNDAVQAVRRKAWNDGVTPSGQVVVQGSYPNQFTVDYGAFFLPEATVHFPRDCTSLDMAAVLELMANGKVSYSDLITWKGAPEDCAEIYGRLDAREPGLLTGAFVWH